MFNAAAILAIASCFGGILSGTARYKYVSTQYGQVRGRVAEDGNYLAFLGVPYAAPPVGENRFVEPRPVIPWNGTLDAIRTVKCPQMGEGEEDCLILNIFTPTRTIAEPLPVLFYIHGGSFIMGSGQTKGVEPLIKEGIVVVTINYRLGALGFLCLGTKEAPGNAGLKDQVAALRWVQENIANFGGDPTKVTVHGMSAGGAAVEYLLLSDLSKGLFRNAVVESGSATPVWASDSDPIATAVNVAKLLSFPLDLKSLTGRYQTVSAKALTNANFKYYTDTIDGSFGFVPCVEKALDGVHPFITKSPHEILISQDYDSVPVMFVFASLEGLYLRSAEFYELNYKGRMEADFVDFVPADLIFDSVELKNATAKDIKQFYFGTDPIGDDSVIDYLNYFGDSLVLHSLLNSVEAHARNGNPVFLMEFAYKGKMGSFEQFYESIHSAGHGDSIKHAILINPTTTDADRKAVRRIAKLLANFVKHRHPAPTTDEVILVTWPPVLASQNLTYLHFGDDLKIMHQLNSSFHRRKLFWDDLYGKHRRYLPAVDPKSYISHIENLALDSTI